MAAISSIIALGVLVGEYVHHSPLNLPLLRPYGYVRRRGICDVKTFESERNGAYPCSE